ncbi:MAG: DUF5317 domain-containing protein [Peptococcaceae bacterium]|nr:DUF5317 domain-containing protein [Peptococcaceae bacterium]
MYLCASVLLAVLTALARGGKWNNLITFRFKRTWLVFTAIGAQLLIFNPLWERYVQAGLATSALYILSMFILLLFLAANMSMSGLRVLGLGILSNSIAIIANGGYMPSSLEALKHILPAETISRLEGGSAAYNVMLITDQTRFKFLCDIFYIPHVNVYSVGDVLIAAGAFIAIQQIMLGRKGQPI